MKNRPFSWCLVALGLGFWLAQVLIQLEAFPQGIFAQDGPGNLTTAFWQLLPYAIVGCVISLVSLELFGKWLLSFALLVVGATGIISWLAYSHGEGLALVGGFLGQGVVAIFSVAAALLAKGIGSLLRKASRIT